MDDFTFRIKDKGKIEVAVRVQLRISSPALPDDKGLVLLGFLAQSIQFGAGEFVEPPIGCGGMIKPQLGIGEGLNGGLSQGHELDRVLQGSQPDGCIHRLADGIQIFIPILPGLTVVVRGLQGHGGIRFDHDAPPLKRTIERAPRVREKENALRAQKRNH